MFGYTDTEFKSFDLVSISTLFEEYNNVPLIDVRSPAEFSEGHIIGAINVPIFSDEERAKVGTTYKQIGKKQAVTLGFTYVSPKMKLIAQKIKDIIVDRDADRAIIYCWRGGMRSRSVCWLVGQSGLNCSQLIGGYKSYRAYNRNYSEQIVQQLIVVGGKTGSGKTKILHELLRKGEQIIDLEALANHKGSAFGFIDEDEQPKVEHFENILFHELFGLNASRIWVENESQSIGRVFIPKGFWTKMKSSILIHLEMDIERRAGHLIEIYGQSDKNLLALAFAKIKKRLGDQRYRESIEFINKNNLKDAAKEALKYYDKAYMHGLENNKAPEIIKINVHDMSYEEIANKLIETANIKEIK